MIIPYVIHTMHQYINIHSLAQTVLRQEINTNKRLPLNIFVFRLFLLFFIYSSSSGWYQRKYHNNNNKSMREKTHSCSLGCSLVKFEWNIRTRLPLLNTSFFEIFISEFLLPFYEDRNDR